MTIRAYQETYLSKAQAALGDAFDYAINSCGISGEDFVKLFTASSVSRQIENGEPAVISGKSGIEITMDVVFETTGRHLENKKAEHFGRFFLSPYFTKKCKPSFQSTLSCGNPSVLFI